MKARNFRYLLNIWPPFWGAGIKVDHISQDYRSASVSLHLRWYNRNYVGTHYGGSLFSMTDPFLMLMYIQVLGRDYLVWDQQASIRFMSPGKGRVRAHFTLSDNDLESARTMTASGEKYIAEHTISVRDSQDLVVAEVKKQIYIRRKARSLKADQNDNR